MLGEYDKLLAYIQKEFQGIRLHVDFWTGECYLS